MYLLHFGLTLFAIFQMQIHFQPFNNFCEKNYEERVYQQEIIKETDDKISDYIINKIIENENKFIELAIVKEVDTNTKNIIKDEKQEIISNEIVIEEVIEEKTLPQNLVVLENKQLYMDIVNEIIILTNNERVANGLNELQYDDELTNIAMERAIEGACNNYFSHTRPNGEDFVSLYEYNNINFSICGENLGRYQTSAIEVFNDWMNSPTHKENILYDFDYIGVGVAIDSEGNYYFVQEFKKQ